MSAVPPSAPHNVNNNSAHLKRVGQPKIKKEKNTKTRSPRDPQTMESRGISAAFHNENRAQTGSCSTNCSVSDFIHVCLFLFQLQFLCLA